MKGGGRDCGFFTEMFGAVVAVDILIESLVVMMV